MEQNRQGSLGRQIKCNMYHLFKSSFLISLSKIPVLLWPCTASSFNAASTCNLGGDVYSSLPNFICDIFTRRDENKT